VRLSAFAFVSFGASGLLLSYALAVIAATFVSLLVVYRRLGLRSSGIANIPRTQSFAASNWVSGIASLVPWGLTPLLVASSQGAKAATWVAIPLLTGALFAAVPGLLARSLFAEASKSPEHLGRLLRRALPRALTLTALTSGGAALAAPFILRLFGPEYAAHSTTLFRLLALSALVSVPNFFADVVLNVRRDVLGFAYANVLGCCAFFGVILVAIHGSAGGSPTAVGWGWVGGNAAYGLIACFFAVRRRYRGDRFGSTIAEAQRVR
jgi:O-antigen/teichoic acid export membrane protein